MEHVSGEIGISVATLERWRADALANGSGTLNPERDSIVRAAISHILLSGSIGEPAVPSRPGRAQAAARNEGEERSGATRSALSRVSLARLASTGPSPQ